MLETQASSESTTAAQPDTSTRTEAVTQMDWKSFTAAVVEDVAWPLAVVTILLLFRVELLKLIPQLQKLKFKDLELEFAKQLSAAAAEAGLSPPLSAEEEPTEDRPMLRRGGVDHYVEALAAVSPRAAILESWVAFEVLAQRALEKMVGGPTPRPLQISEVFDLLRKGNVISTAEQRALERLRELRNHVVHGPDVMLTRERTIEYVTVLNKIADRIRDAIG